MGFWKFGTRYRNLTRRPSRRSARDRRVEMVEVHAVRLLAHADERRAGVSERRDRAGVGRQLHQRHVAGIEQHARDEVESLLRAGGDDDALGAAVDAARLA